MLGLCGKNKKNDNKFSMFGFVYFFAVKNVVTEIFRQYEYYDCQVAT